MGGNYLYPVILTSNMTLFIDYCLGDFVTHPEMPDWGIGQVQSVDGSRVTVNFENSGKQLINASIILLVPVATETE